MTNYESLLNRFIESAQKTGAKIEIVSNKDNQLSEALFKLVASDDKIVRANEELLGTMAPDYFSGDEKSPSYISLEKLADADVGISYAFAGIVRTGSIAVNLSADWNGYVSLLPSKHIAIVKADNMVERPRDIFNDELINEFEPNKGIVFITGPSATADMGELVKGAHGPAQLHIIIVKELNDAEEN